VANFDRYDAVGSCECGVNFAIAPAQREGRAIVVLPSAGFEFDADGFDGIQSRIDAVGDDCGEWLPDCANPAIGEDWPVRESQILNEPIDRGPSEPACVGSRQNETDARNRARLSDVEPDDAARCRGRTRECEMQTVVGTQVRDEPAFAAKKSPVLDAPAGRANAIRRRCRMGRNADQQVDLPKIGYCALRSRRD